jgi:hypothetical protein
MEVHQENSFLRGDKLRKGSKEGHKKGIQGAILHGITSQQLERKIHYERIELSVINKSQKFEDGNYKQKLLKLTSDGIFSFMFFNNQLKDRIALKNNLKISS